MLAAYRNATPRYGRARCSALLERLLHCGASSGRNPAARDFLRFLTEDLQRARRLEAGLPGEPNQCRDSPGA